MGRRDFRKRESKKPKKEAKKIATTILPPSIEVEVVKKGKRREEGEEPEA
jgi:hypothetical protein